MLFVVTQQMISSVRYKTCKIQVIIVYTGLKLTICGGLSMIFYYGEDLNNFMKNARDLTLE